MLSPAITERLRTCPGCGHESIIVDDFMKADLVDPECWTGHCNCRKKEFLSECCEWPQDYRRPTICPGCRDNAVFVDEQGQEECDCGWES